MSRNHIPLIVSGELSMVCPICEKGHVSGEFDCDRDEYLKDSKEDRVKCVLSCNKCLRELSFEYERIAGLPEFTGAKLYKFEGNKRVQI